MDQDDKMKRRRRRADMDSQLISGHYAVPRARPFTDLPGPFGRADDAQRETENADAPTRDTDSEATSDGDASTAPRAASSLAHAAADTTTTTRARRARRARKVALGAGAGAVAAVAIAAALAAWLPRVDRRPEPRALPTSVAPSHVRSAAPLPAIHAAPPVRVAPAPLPAPAAPRHATVTAPESPRTLKPAAAMARMRAAHVIERAKTRRHLEHHAAPEARDTQPDAFASPDLQPPAVTPLPPLPSQPVPTPQSPQWVPRMQTRLLGG